MSDKLYFVPIIAEALKGPDIEEALGRAFHEIIRTGNEEQYAEGFRSFKLFMHTACGRHNLVSTHYICGLMAELATGTFEGTAQEAKSLLAIISSRPEWQARYEAILRRQESADLMRNSFPVISMVSEKGPARYVSFAKGPGCQHVNDILPGNCRLELFNTGRIIWEGQLIAEELIWSEAREGENLRLAAGEKEEKPTREIDLLNNGDLILRIYAGTESGRIEIELTR